MKDNKTSVVLLSNWDVNGDIKGWKKTIKGTKTRRNF